MLEPRDLFEVIDRISPSEVGNEILVARRNAPPMRELRWMWSREKLAVFRDGMHMWNADLPRLGTDGLHEAFI